MLILVVVYSLAGDLGGIDGNNKLAQFEL